MTEGTMDLLIELFGYLCGRGRCFVVDGAALPVCERCLGLYVGAAVTVVWVVAARLWRRGLPPGAVVAGHLVVLAGAMLGGLHVIVSGPLWRLICGLTTGHVLMLWLALGAVHLWRAGRLSPVPPRRWGRGQTVPAMAIVILLAIAGAASLTVPGLKRLGETTPAGAVATGALSWAWGFWTILAAAGAVALAVAVVCAVMSVAAFAGRASRRSRDNRTGQ
ncbi:MAG: DUF2085 domain-containing protein [Phycisphaerae bacterium]|nr:DUF2085 domain-containing protein [Phycisphaerae bacterium]